MGGKLQKRDATSDVSAATALFSAEQWANKSGTENW
jgi:hypothetical protein